MINTDKEAEKYNEMFIIGTYELSNTNINIDR